jgi:hypothetical protein
LILYGVPLPTTPAKRSCGLTLKWKPKVSILI